MTNYFFQLILIEEIKRKSLGSDIKTFYSSLPENELRLQFISTEAALSRGSLPLIEKFLLKQNKDRKYIDKKLSELSNYDFYFSSQIIYNKIIKSIKDPGDIIDELDRQAKSGELDHELSLHMQS